MKVRLRARLLTSWRKEFEVAKAYILQNTLEALGLVEYKKRKGRNYVNSVYFFEKLKENL